jgi:hypothetical protein
MPKLMRFRLLVLLCCCCFSLTPAFAQPTPPPGSIVYVVQAGDTLASIAGRFRISLVALAATNNYAEDAAPAAGTMLIIPLVADAAPYPTNTSAPSATPRADQPTATPNVVTPLVATNTPESVIVTPLIATNTPESGAQATPGAMATPAALILPNLDRPLPGPEEINEIAIDQIVIIDEDAAANIVMIFERGQRLGRSARAFSKLGDSTIESPYFLDRFDVGQGSYNLGAFGYLQTAVDYFQGSFARQGVAVIRGLHSWSVFDPMWANDYVCEPRETMLECEFRIHNPAYLFVRIGSNDVGAPTAFENNLRDIIAFATTNGVIPILGTKADRHDGPGNRNNEVIRALADEFNLPLWDFDLVAGTLPNRGVGGDGVHLTTWYAHDFTNPEAFRRGYGVHTITALLALYKTWLVVLESGGI